MDDRQKWYWDLGFKIVGPLLTVAGILVGVWQFNIGEERKAIYEHASALWLKRLDTYSDVAKLAGSIAAAPGGQPAQSDINAFLAAYWGDMILVEDTEVERTMIAFRTEIEDFKRGRSNTDRLKQRADHLMKSLRQSLEAREPQP
ncbi:hypothetical protein GGE07_005968 [Sinorhizobium terangae]|uniref:DUF4381 family protein n=1 Tax=Sinorhizobium terangae TaxID=110322 RepID=A0A6N7LLM2_SINTE|nr:hypothetical protein [Sinorhizobium terangae]MBB4189286.1 hypothetical protein [Sinorhizobium terangae]MQX18200.1 hypothetical protein [Sinorhizobium terangae]